VKECRVLKVLINDDVSQNFVKEGKEKNLLFYVEKINMKWMIYKIIFIYLTFFNDVCAIKKNI